MTISTTRERQPWDKRPGESPKAFEAFKLYLNLGSERTLAKAAWDIQKHVSLLRKWSAECEWTARTDAWDVHMGQIAQEQKERVAKEVAEKWARRRLEAADANWAKAQELRAWADDARRKAPLFETEVEETDPETGKPVTIIVKPLKWTMQTVLDAYKTAALLAASAITEATQGITDDDGFEPATATPDELRAYLVKKGVKALPGPG